MEDMDDTANFLHKRENMYANLSRRYNKVSRNSPRMIPQINSKLSHTMPPEEVQEKHHVETDFPEFLAEEENTGTADIVDMPTSLEETLPQDATPDHSALILGMIFALLIGAFVGYYFNRIKQSTK
jgi:hypothetical protein